LDGQRRQRRDRRLSGRVSICAQYAPTRVTIRRRVRPPGRLALIWVFGVLACAQHPFDRKLVEPSKVGTIARTDTSFLKAHMRDGQLYLFSSWTVDERAGTVSGPGARLGVDRRGRDSGMFTIRIADVALFETNAPDHGGAATIAPLAVITVASAALTVICL